MRNIKTQFKTNFLRGLLREANVRGLSSFFVLLSCVFLNAQEPIRKGYFNAFRGDYTNKIADTMGLNRTTLIKANFDAMGLLATNVDSLDVWVKSPDYYYGDSAPQQWYQLNIFDKIHVSELTTTSVKINIWLDLHEVAYIRFRSLGNEWVSGGEWLETNHGQDMLLYKDELLPNTVYEYQLYVDGTFSPILTFKTL